MIPQGRHIPEPDSKIDGRIVFLAVFFLFDHYLLKLGGFGREENVVEIDPRGFERHSLAGIADTRRSDGPRIVGNHHLENTL